MSVDKVLSRIRDAPSEEAAYEAQQMLKTVYHRLRSHSKLVESHDLLAHGAQAQLANQRVTCGSELGCLLVDAYAQDGCAADTAEVQRIVDVLTAFPESAAAPDTEASIAEAARVGSAAIRWARKQGNAEACRGLHDVLARHAAGALADGTSLAASAEHFARGSDMDAFAAAILRAASNESAEDDEDLFVSRAVLQVLAAGRREEQQQQLGNARRLLQALSAHMLPARPLSNFLHLLLRALEVRSLALAELLEREYAASLARDGHLGELLQAVKQAYLGAPAQGMGGLLGSLFGGMLAGSPAEEQPA